MAPQARYGKSQFVALARGQLKALVGQKNALAALSHHNSQRRGNLSSQMDDVLTRLLPALDATAISAVADVLAVNPRRWLEWAAGAQAALRQSQNARQAAGMLRACIEPAAQQAYNTARQEFIVARTRLADAQRAEQTADAAVSAARRALTGIPVALQQARADLNAAQQGSKLSLTAASAMLETAKSCEKSFDGEAIEALRTRSWGTADYSGVPVLSAGWWRDRAAARRAKERSSYESFAQLHTAYEQAKNRVTTAHMAYVAAERVDMLQRRLEKLLSSAPTKHADFETSKEQLIRAQAVVKTRDQQTWLARENLGSVQRVIDAQTAQVNDFASSVNACATAYAQCNHLLAQMRRQIAEIVERRGLARLNVAKQPTTPLALGVVRLDLLQKKRFYLRAVEQQFFPKLSQGISAGTAHVTARVKEWESPKKNMNFMSHPELLEDLGHAALSRRQATLDFCTQLTDEVYRSQPDEAWAARHAAEPWTWWSAFTHGRHDAAFVPPQPRAASTPETSSQPTTPVSRQSESSGVSLSDALVWRFVAGDFGATNAATD